MKKTKLKTVNVFLFIFGVTEVFFVSRTNETTKIRTDNFSTFPLYLFDRSEETSNESIILKTKNKKKSGRNFDINLESTCITYFRSDNTKTSIF